MTFQVGSWPDANDIARFAHTLKQTEDDVIRDIVRLVTIASLVHDEVLNEDWVLAGGMAMRLRGSNRFTRIDTDTSRRDGYPDYDDLEVRLTIEEDELSVKPAKAEVWKTGEALVKAAPIEYRAVFAEVGAAEIKSTFTFTVAWRGLVEPAEHLALIHPYGPQLNIGVPMVPVMELTEQLAEKMVGWTMHKLMKHYVDVAWAWLNLRAQIRLDRLPDLIEAKLDAGREHFSRSYADVRVATVVLALNDPDGHDPPLGKAQDDHAQDLRFGEGALGKREAVDAMKGLLRELLPLVIGRRQGKDSPGEGSS